MNNILRLFEEVERIAEFRNWKKKDPHFLISHGKILDHCYIRIRPDNLKYYSDLKLKGFSDISILDMIKEVILLYRSGEHIPNRTYLILHNDYDFQIDLVPKVLL